MGHSKDDKDDRDPKSIARRAFLKVGGLGAAALASGAAARGPVEAGQAAPARGGQAPAPRGSQSRRNLDPVPEAAPKMHFAVFTDTHVGQHNRSPQWDFAQQLDKLADDIMDNALPCEFVVHLGDGAFNSTAHVNGVGLPENMKGDKRNNLKDFLISHVNVPFHYIGGNIDLTDYSNNPGPKGHEHDPFVLMKTYINETELNHYPYAFMATIT